MTKIISMPSWQKDRNKFNETTYCLYATLTSWKYALDLPKPGESGCEPAVFLHLYGLIEPCPIIQESMSLGLFITCQQAESSGGFPRPPWQLDLVPAMDDPPLPQSLEAELILEETLLQDLKECLFLTAKSPESSLEVLLTIRENAAVRPDDLAERSFSIVEFGFTLNHQKGSR